MGRSRSQGVQAALLRYLRPEPPLGQRKGITPPNPLKRASDPPPTNDDSAAAPPSYKFIETIMPDASEEERAEASRNWFAYLVSRCDFGHRYQVVIS
jgi:hypothetical protein